MNIEKSLSCYIEATHTHGAETDTCDNFKRINKAYDRIKKSYYELIQTEEGRLELKKLLGSADDYVRSWTAMLLIFDYPKECESILRGLVNRRGLWKSTITTFLDEWENGNVDSVF